MARHCLGRCRWQGQCAGRAISLIPWTLQVCQHPHSPLVQPVQPFLILVGTGSGGSWGESSMQPPALTPALTGASGPGTQWSRCTGWWLMWGSTGNSCPGAAGCAPPPWAGAAGRARGRLPAPPGALPLPGLPGLRVDPGWQGRTGVLQVLLGWRASGCTEGAGDPNTSVRWGPGGGHGSGNIPACGHGSRSPSTLLVPQAGSRDCRHCRFRHLELLWRFGPGWPGRTDACLLDLWASAATCTGPAGAGGAAATTGCRSASSPETPAFRRRQPRPGLLPGPRQNAGTPGSPDRDPRAGGGL